MPNPYQSPETTQAPVLPPGTPPALRQILFSMKGRIPRRAYWLFSAVAGVLMFIAVAIVAIFYTVSRPTGTHLSGPVTSSVGMSPIIAVLIGIIYILVIWISLCLGAKRCHDHDKSAWWMLIPVYGFILVGFLRGTVGPNKYGQDPT